MYIVHGTIARPGSFVLSFVEDQTSSHSLWVAHKPLLHAMLSFYSPSLTSFFLKKCGKYLKINFADLSFLKGGEEELITSKTKDFKPEPRVVQLLPDKRNHGGLLLAAR